MQNINNYSYFSEENKYTLQTFFKSEVCKLAAPQKKCPP